jgi:GNAT superfamily N-acetyltransferase
LAFDGEICVGFVTLANDAILLDEGERLEGLPPRLPALKIAQLGVEGIYARQGIGSHLVAFALSVARRQRAQVGCLYLTLDAKPDSVEFYRKLGFTINKAERRERRKREGEKYKPSESPISMRLDIRETGEP